MTNIKNIKYWEMREARNMYKDMQLAEDCAKELSVIYSKAAIYTAKQIEGIFNRFASKHHLTRDEAINLLSEADSKDFEKLLEVYKNKTGAQKREVLAELEAPAYKNRMKRLDDINKSINKLINAIESKERDAIGKTMRQVYESSYHHAVYEAARMSGLDLQTGPIDEGALETILKKKWSGQNYSERVWNNTQKVADALKEELMIGALTGKTEKEMTDSINEQFLSGRNNARRLVRTESSYIHNEAHFQAYKDYGIEEYRFVATLDLRTSQICRERDGSVYRVNDKKIGVNAPPMHPWCRSTTIMNLDDETMHNLERFARDPVTGERIKVPADETYKEWHQRMVEKHGAEAINTAEKSIKNYSSDKKQYKEYANLLGNENVPLSLSKFQSLKYNNPDEWKHLKSFYKFKQLNPKLTYNDFLLHSIRNYAPGVPQLPEKVKGYALKDDEAKKDKNHLFDRMLERNITSDELQEYVDNALVMFNQWNGKRKLFISEKGASVVMLRGDKWIFKTGMKYTDYGDNYMAILEVLKRWKK